MNLPLTPQESADTVRAIRAIGNVLAGSSRTIRLQALASMLIAEESSHPAGTIDELLAELRAKVPQARADLAELHARN